MPNEMLSPDAWDVARGRILPSAPSHTTVNSNGSTNGYGAVRTRDDGSTYLHEGEDINHVGGPAANQNHPPVHTPVAGTVTEVGGRYGAVGIKDAEGYTHRFLHLDSQNVTVGQQIKADARLGGMGGQGPGGPNHYSQHVHYEVRDPNGQLVDPKQFHRARAQSQSQSQSQGSQGNTSQSRAPAAWRGDETERLIQENRDRNPVGSDPLKQAEVQILIGMSPTLKGDVERLKAEYWNFEFIEDYSRVSEKDGKKIVYINNEGNEVGTVNCLSHETGHALKSVQIEYGKGKTGYVDSRLEDEGAATMKNLQIRDEILANSKERKGYSIDIGVNCGEAYCNTRYKGIWDKYLADGDAESARKEIGELKRHELMGNNRETYEQYYGRGWDELQQKVQENPPALQPSAPAASNQADMQPQSFFR